MEFKNILIEKDGNIGCISINRQEKLNALNTETINELSQAFNQLELDAHCRAIILTGVGEKAFVAGADILEFKNFKSDEAEDLSRVGHHTLFNKIENLKKPVIAAINGFALGGGLELALACHIRYASENAKLGLPEVTLGLIPGYGGTQRLPQAVGKSWANEIILSAKMLNAQKAKEIGLVNEVFTLSELIEKAKELAVLISKNSSTAITKAIELINLADQPAALEKEIKSFGTCFGTKDQEEGVNAFLEKRKPNF